MANDPSEVQEVIVYAYIPWPSGGGAPGGSGGGRDIGDLSSSTSDTNYPVYDCSHNERLSVCQSIAQAIMAKPDGTTNEYGALGYTDSDGSFKSAPLGTLGESGKTNFDTTGISSYSQVEVAAHTHPGGTSWPSSGDYRSAAAMVAQGADPNKLMLVIINPPSSSSPNGLVSTYKFSDLKAPPKEYLDTQSINQPGWNPTPLDAFAISATLPAC